MLGSRDASFPQLIESFPGLLQLPIESHVKLMVEFLHHIGVPEGCLGKLFLLFPPLIFYDIEKEVKPRLLALQKVCISMMILIYLLNRVVGVKIAFVCVVCYCGLVSL